MNKYTSKMSSFIKKIVIISIFFLISFKAYAACKFELELGDKVSKIEKKYGPPFPLEFVGDDQLGLIAADADEVCPNHSLKDVALEYRFLNDELAAVNLISLEPDSDTKKSKKTTIMNYVKRNYGNFDTGQNPESYIGYKVFERTRQFVVYQRMDDGSGLIQEEMYISNNKYDELLAEFFNKLEEDMAESESQN